MSVIDNRDLEYCNVALEEIPLAELQRVSSTVAIAISAANGTTEAHTVFEEEQGNHSTVLFFKSKVSC